MFPANPLFIIFLQKGTVCVVLIDAQKENWKFSIILMNISEHIFHLWFHFLYPANYTCQMLLQSNTMQDLRFTAYKLLDKNNN